MLHVKLMQKNNTGNVPLPSYDFIAGLISVRGSFLWVKQKNSEVPVFQIKIQSEEYDLLQLLKDKLEIKETIHRYSHQNREYSILLIRSRRTIETKLIPILDGRLFGMKQTEFDMWKKKYFEKKLEFAYRYHQTF